MALRRKFTQTRFFKAIIVATVVALLAWFPPKPISEPIRSLISLTVWPFQKAVSFVAFEVSGTTGFLSSIGSLKDKNAALEKERLRLLAENARLSDLVKDDEALRHELGLPGRSGFSLRAAQVIGHGDTGGSARSLIIDHGSLSGIGKGMAVVVAPEDGSSVSSSAVLVGRVDEVFPASARVMLISDPESRINASVPDTDARGIVKGEHGLGAMLDMVLQADTIRSGSAVVTSGLGGELPAGLFIGTLQDPGFSPDKLFRRAPIVFPLDYDRLRYVFVITNTVQP